MEAISTKISGAGQNILLKLLFSDLFLSYVMRTIKMNAAIRAASESEKTYTTG